MCLGALVNGLFAAKIVGATMPIAWYWVLPAATWCVYTLDHLLDAHRIGAQAHTGRHRYHYQHAQTLWVALTVVSVTCLWAFWLPTRVIVFGIVVCVCVGLHLALVKWVGNRISKLLAKEVGVGLVYVAGVWGAPILLAPASLTLVQGLLPAQFLALALINLLIFSSYEQLTDTRDGHTSFVQAIGTRATQRIILGLGVFVLMTSAVQFYIGIDNVPRIFLAAYPLMLALLWWISFDTRRFRPHERYRVVGDGVFLLPLVAIGYMALKAI